MPALKRPLSTEPRAHAGSVRRARGRRARHVGRVAEIAAAFWLMMKGWRIIGLRQKIQGVEIDLLARRGRVLAIVEVKSRPDIPAALAAVSRDQQVRLRRAGAALAVRPGLQGLSTRLDLVALAPHRLPRHIADAWPDYGRENPGTANRS